LSYRRGNSNVVEPAAVITAAGDDLVVYCLTTGGVLAVAPELDLVSGLLTVLAAVLAERTVRFNDAFTGGVRTLRC
jgi:hypothetical protein